MRRAGPKNVYTAPGLKTLRVLIMNMLHRVWRGGVESLLNE